MFFGFWRQLLDPLACFWHDTDITDYDQVRYGYNYDGNAADIYNSSGNYHWAERSIARVYIYLGRVPVLMSGNKWLYGIGYVYLDKYFVYEIQDSDMTGGCLAEIRFATVINQIKYIISNLTQNSAPSQTLSTCEAPDLAITCPIVTGKQIGRAHV